jgi:hypothetical protein
MNSQSLVGTWEKKTDKGKLDDMDTHKRSLDGKAGFVCVIFAALERSFGLDTCPNNDNRLVPSSLLIRAKMREFVERAPQSMKRGWIQSEKGA